MNVQLKRLSLAMVNATMISVAGCGGGTSTGDSSATVPDVTAVPAVAVPTTTDVSTTVLDGAIKGAIVCIDKNANGQCDADEAQGKTDVAGSVTLAVPTEDAGKYPLLAIVGTDAFDADNGPVGVAYTMSTPADRTSLISPLTTLVQQTVASAGFTSVEAAKAVQDATGITTSPFDDFTKPAARAAASTTNSPDAAVVSRILVVAMQQQGAALAQTLGSAAIDGSLITRADLDRAIQKKMLEQLTAVAAAAATPPLLLRPHLRAKKRRFWLPPTNLWRHLASTP